MAHKLILTPVILIAALAGFWHIDNKPETAGGSHEVGLRFISNGEYNGTFLRVDSDDPDESSLSFPVAADDSPNYLQIGDEAPDFTLLDMDGVSHTLSDYWGRVVVLAFFANW